jgi:hypothetical protein
MHKLKSIARFMQAGVARKVLESQHRPNRLELSIGKRDKDAVANRPSFEANALANP